MLRVRAATEADAEAIVQLTAAGWRAAYPGIVPAELIEKLPIEGWRHDIGAGLRSPEGDAFTRIAELDGEITGYCYVAAPGREEPERSTIAELVAVYVAPEHWRRGAGRALLESAEEKARLPGYTELILWSFEENRGALAFYRALGWSEDGTHRPHRATGVATTRLRRSLT
jgi:GNAT superfamily N-acetyltransferase